MTSSVRLTMIVAAGWLTIHLAGLAAQGPAEPIRSGSEGPDIRVTTDMVVLQVAVLDRGSRFVPNLAQSQFTVLEDGMPQTISVFSHEDGPATIGLVIDNSGSMRPKLREVAAAAQAFALGSHPSNEFFVYNFNERVWPGLPDDALFTNDRAVLFLSLQHIKAIGKTALYDALSRAFDHMNMAAHSRRAIVLISDGGDNASRTRLQEVLDRARRSDVVIYAMGLFEPYADDKNPEVLKQLAAATGGEAFMPDDVREATDTLLRVAQDIRHVYTIGYIPTNAKHDGTDRSIKVSLSGQQSNTWKVRARTGYRAPIDGTR